MPMMYVPLTVSLSPTVRSTSSFTQPVSSSRVAAARSTAAQPGGRAGWRMGGHGSRGRCGRLWTMQPITLTEEQHEFRRVLRQFCDDKIAPLAASNDERAEYSWETFRALQSMELTALQLPAEYGGAGRRSRHPGHRRRGAGPGRRVGQPHVPDLEARDAAGHQLRLRGAEEEVHPADRRRARARRRTACRRPTPAPTWRR